MKIAVVGVPRGGTSLVSGLVRILGFRLPGPEGFQVCDLGENKVLRRFDNPHKVNARDLSIRINAIPDDEGLVWKDPAVAMYAHYVRWSSWRVIRVDRDPDAVAASERRWRQNIPNARKRAEDMYRIIGDRIPYPTLRMQMEDVRSEPVEALHKIADMLDVSAPTAKQEGAAKFFASQPGYRCPIPGACTLPH